MDGAIFDNEGSKATGGRAFRGKTVLWTVFKNKPPGTPEFAEHISVRNSGTNFFELGIGGQAVCAEGGGVALNEREGIGDELII